MRVARAIFPKENGLLLVKESCESAPPGNGAKAAPKSVDPKIEPPGQN
jgi:hypothetical protein